MADDERNLQYTIEHKLDKDIGYHIVIFCTYKTLSLKKETNIFLIRLSAPNEGLHCQRLTLQSHRHHRYLHRCLYKFENYDVHSTLERTAECQWTSIESNYYLIG